MRWRRDRAGTRERESASEGAAEPSGVAPGLVTDSRVAGEHVYVEVRVRRDQVEVPSQGDEVLLDSRPVWYVEGTSDIGTSKLHNRLRPHASYQALFVDDLPLARRVAELLNEHGEGDGG